MRSSIRSFELPTGPTVPYGIPPTYDTAKYTIEYSTPRIGPDRYPTQRIRIHPIKFSNLSLSTSLSPSPFDMVTAEEIDISHWTLADVTNFLEASPDASTKEPPEFEVQFSMSRL